MNRSRADGRISEWLLNFVSHLGENFHLSKKLRERLCAVGIEHLEENPEPLTDETEVAEWEEAPWKKRLELLNRSRKR